MLGGSGVAVPAAAAFTHLVDPNQRNVVLPVVSRSGNTLTVKAPPSADVAPPGPYMLFVNKQTDKGLVPSKSAQLFLGLAGLERRAAAMRRGGAKKHGAKKHHARKSATTRHHARHVRNHAARPAQQG